VAPLISALQSLNAALSVAIIAAAAHIATSVRGVLSSANPPFPEQSLCHHRDSIAPSAFDSRPCCIEI